MITDSRRLSSSFKSPDAVSKERLPIEFEQTSSAKESVRWAGVCLAGRISHSSTEQPLPAACQAASLPARPPPITVTSAIAGYPPYKRRTVGAIFYAKNGTSRGSNQRSHSGAVDAGGYVA